MEKFKFNTVDEYIATFPDDVKCILSELREVIRAVAPDANEKISYQMPTFSMGGNIIHYAAFKHHIGVYPGASGVAAFQDELTDYKTSKGAIQFPLDKPLPYDLINRIVQYNIEKNREKSRSKKEKN